MTRLAKVIDTNTNGQIKVQIIPELQGLPDDKLPWAYPKQDYNCTKDFKVDLPDKDDYILVEVNDTWTTFSYDGSRPYSEHDSKSTDAYNLIKEYKKITPTYIDYSSDPGMAIFKADDSIGIVFGTKIFVVAEKSESSWTFKVQNGENISVEISDKVKINGDHLVVT